MSQSDSAPNGRKVRVTGPGISPTLFRLSAAVLAAGVTFGAFAQEVQRKIARTEIPLSDVSIILETNATDCDTGLQLFFDGDAWKSVKVEDPNGTTIFEVTARGSLSLLGLTEQFNETNEPPMKELVEGFPELECDEPEFSLQKLFRLFPQGNYEFEGRTIEGKKLEGETKLSHVIPAPPRIISPDDSLQDPKNIVVEWERVDKPILPGFGRGPSDSVKIVGFRVIVSREAPKPLVEFEAELSADDTKVKIPPQFLQPNGRYQFEVMQIDVSGNQTIAESEFRTKP